MSQGRYRIHPVVLVFGLGLLITFGLVWAQEPPEVAIPEVATPEVEVPVVETGHVDPALALTEGNQLFFDGQMEAAAAAYLAGYSADHPHSTLAYNLGTAHHHLGHLPEAILWYRRAGNLEDPWLEENLWLARRSLGTRPLPSVGVLGFLARHADLVRWCAVGLAWLTVAFLAAASRLSVRSLVAAFVFSGMVYATSFVGERWGPEPAVLMQACQEGDVELPAGTEAWVRVAGDDRYQVMGLPVACPSSAVVLVLGSSV